MADYPLMFRLTHAVRCPTFEALAVLDGRILMVPEDDLWWCHGIEPGGLTAHGEGPVVAFELFCLALREVLNDLAEASQDFQAFQSDAESFFKTDITEETRWKEAMIAVRRSILEGVPLEEPFRDMERSGPRESSISIKPMIEYATAPMSAVRTGPSVSIPLDQAA